MPTADTVLVVQIVLNIIVVNIIILCFTGFAVFKCPLVRIESSYSSFPRNFKDFWLFMHRYELFLSIKLMDL